MKLRKTVPEIFQLEQMSVKCLVVSEEENTLIICQKRVQSFFGNTGKFSIGLGKVEMLLSSSKLFISVCLKVQTIFKNRKLTPPSVEVNLESKYKLPLGKDHHIRNNRNFPSYIKIPDILSNLVPKDLFLTFIQVSKRSKII